MRAASVALAACLALLPGCASKTQVLVSVDTRDLAVPAEVARVRISVTNPGAGGQAAYTSQDLPLCSGPQTSGCFAFPISVTLIPGNKAPDALVRVEVEAFDTSGVQVSADATVFAFTPGTTQRIDFFLSRSCLGTRCAAKDQACGDGACAELLPGPLTSPAADLGEAPRPPITRVSAIAGRIDAGQTPQLPPADAEAGDIVLLAVHSNTTVPAPANAWKLLGSLSGSTVYARIAGAGERDNQSAYLFGGAVGDAMDFTRLVYRGARSAEAGISSQVVVPTFTFPSVPVAAGALLVGIAATGFETSCSSAGGIKHIIKLSDWLIFDEGPLPAGPAPEETLSCTSFVAAATGYLHQIVLVP